MLQQSNESHTYTGDGNLGFLESKNYRGQIEKLHIADFRAKSSFWAGIRIPLRSPGEFQFDLEDIDLDTGLTRRILLASGIKNIESGNLLLVSSNRLGLTLPSEIFAVGGTGAEEMPKRTTHHFSFELHKRKRKVNGNFVGVVLNPSHSGFASMRINADINNFSLELPNQNAWENFLNMTYQSLDAVIQAEKNLRAIQASGSDQILMSQAELDRALDWVVAGNQVDSFARPVLQTPLNIQISN